MKRVRIHGLSLVELIIVMAMASILVLTTSSLLLGANQTFRQMYDFVHHPVHQDSKALAIAFETISRKSNRTNYAIYNVDGQVFAEAQPEPGDSIASGQAVEFRYWSRPFYELSREMDHIDTADTGPRYALFYLTDDKLYVDYGDVVDGVGAIQNGSRQTDNIITQRLVEHVDMGQQQDIFSHEVVGGSGNGCVVLDLQLKDDTGQIAHVKISSLLRVVWPQ